MSEVEASNTTARRREAALAGHRGDGDLARTFLDDPAAIVRATAVTALACASAITTADLARALADPDETVRRRAAGAAIPFHDVDLVPFLKDSSPSVVEQTAWALGERSHNAVNAVPALIEVATSHEDALCREAAVAALGAVGDDAGVPAILNAMNDKPAVRRRAVLAMSPFEGPEIDAALEKAKEDRDWQVRQAAEDLTE